MSLIIIANAVNVDFVIRIYRLSWNFDVCVRKTCADFISLKSNSAWTDWCVFAGVCVRGGGAVGRIRSSVNDPVAT